MSQDPKKGLDALHARVYGREHRMTPRPLPDGYVIDPFLALPGESEEAFADYECYRDLGPGRTVPEVAKAHAKNLQSLYLRQSRERWKERVALYDQFHADSQRAAIVRAYESEAEVLVRRRMTIAEQEWEWHGKLLGKAEQMFAHPLTRATLSKDGKQITINPAKWSFYTLVQVLELASQLGRRATELPTTFTQVDSHFTDHTQGGIDLSTLTPEQREKMERLQAEMSAQALAILSGDDPERVAAEIVVPADQRDEPPAWYPGAGALPAPPGRDE